MKTKRMKSILLIGLAMLVVTGVIWGSFNAVSASAAAQIRESVEQQARMAEGSSDVAEPETPEDETVAQTNGIGVQKRNRFAKGEGAGKGNADASGMRIRARDGSEGENCDGTCPFYETREERRERNRVDGEGRARNRSGGENCDGTCPYYETREERRAENRANRTCDGQGGENGDETCPNYETREQRRAENQGRNRARNGK
jgi:hypothetical protein